MRIIYTSQYQSDVEEWHSTPEIGDAVMANRLRAMDRSMISNNGTIYLHHPTQRLDEVGRYLAETKGAKPLLFDPVTLGTPLALCKFGA